MELGYDIDHLYREAHTRWLKPVEVYFILKSYEDHQLTHQVPQKPASGSLYLFNKRVLKFFRNDGHRWRRRKDKKTIAEGHERLKVGDAEALNCYYAHGEENRNFQRRSFWILDLAYEHIVLVHYRDISEGRQSARSISQFSTLSSSAFSPSPNSFATHQPESFLIDKSYEMCDNQSILCSLEISSNENINNHGMSLLGVSERINEVAILPVPDLSQALRTIEKQLSLDDDKVKEFKALPIDNGSSNDLEDALRAYDLSWQTSNGLDLLPLQPQLDDQIRQHQLTGVVVDDIWKDVLDSSMTLLNVESQSQLGGNASVMITERVDSLQYPEYSPAQNASYGINPNSYSPLFDISELEISLEDNISLTIAQKQFSIREICPEWCYTSEGTKIVIIGSFLCNPSDCAWACMFDDIEVPVKIIQEGVISCHVPPHSPGKVTLCITSGNGESCSEIRSFEYRPKPNVCSPLEADTCKSSEELLLLVRFVQMLLSDLVPKGNVFESRVNLLGKSRISEESWSQVIDALLIGNSATLGTLDWLLQELLKDKLEVWLSFRLEKNNHEDCSLSKKEQGIIHTVAGLGFDWALQPILNCGVSINFRDINGCTALHWAARFGREKMVAALIASGASAGAVTHPNSRDPVGKTAASVAATCGHKGLAGYLSEVALTSHLSSLTLEESELSKESAAVEADRTINSLSVGSSSTEEDLKDTLAAFRNSYQAATRIQLAFRAHSFRKRQHAEAAAAIAACNGDEYSILSNDIEGLSTAAKLSFGNARDYNIAALCIQKKFKGWKRRKEFLSLRQKVVRIQAHVRGYQARMYYKVCWAVGILEKVVLRWRRKGIGLRGFRTDSEFIDESDTEDILKVFQKKVVITAIDEAVSRVLSMVESPEARQQYHRILQKYRQAKVEVENAKSDVSSSSIQSISDMEI